MQIQVHTDSNIEGSVKLTTHVESSVETSLSRFLEQLTRVDVYLHDENSHKGGADDKKCVIEARPAGMKPVAVTHHAGDVDGAIEGALVKMDHLLDHTFGKLDNHKGRLSYGGEQDY